MSIALKQNCMYLLILTLTALGSVLAYHYVHQDWILFREAEAQYEQKNFKEAISLYEKSLGAGFPKAFMSVNLANSYVAVGKFEQAIPWYREYLAKHPKDTDARLGLAKALSWIGNSEESEKEYQKILE